MPPTPSLDPAGWVGFLEISGEKIFKFKIVIPDSRFCLDVPVTIRKRNG